MSRFSDLIDLAITPGSEGLRPVIEKEILHYDILFALDRENLLNDLTFQGGTSLRLCYGSPRFSEDLDFVGGFDFTAAKLAEIEHCIKDHIGARYGLEVYVRTPKETRKTSAGRDLKVDRWQVSVITSPDRPDLPRQKIKLEVVNVPAHTQNLRGLERHHSFLPASYEDILISVETLNEILADKVVALSCCRTYIRHRDVWDLLWLRKRRAEPDPDLVAKKAADYRITDFELFLREMRDRVANIAASKAFHTEMTRFIPPDIRTRTLDRPGFSLWLGSSVQTILQDVHAALFVSRIDP